MPMALTSHEKLDNQKSMAPKFYEKLLCQYSCGKTYKVQKAAHETLVQIDPSFALFKLLPLVYRMTEIGRKAALKMFLKFVAGHIGPLPNRASKFILL
jgi:hypothetical protein